MAVTYNWTINTMDAYPTVGTLTDVVFNVHWTVNGTDGVRTVPAYGTTGITLNPNDTFIPYANLTQDEVVGWVKEALGAEEVASIEADLARQLDELANPKVVTNPLPWVAPAE